MSIKEICEAKTLYELEDMLIDYETVMEDITDILGAEHETVKTMADIVSYVEKEFERRKKLK